MNIWQNYMTPILQKLIHDFQFLPGIGEKTAQRFVHYIFGREQRAAEQFAKTLLTAIENIRHCQQCQNLSEGELCSICTDENRNDDVLCVVEHPSNVMLLEATRAFKGRYFVLHGALSPIDGINPSDLNIGKLLELIHEKDIKEVIVATSSKIEGEATAYYLHDQLKDLVLTTRLAYGIPLGGSLDFVDGPTLSKALIGRQTLSDNCE